MNATVLIKKLVIEIMVPAPLLYVQRAGKAGAVVQVSILCLVFDAHVFLFTSSNK